MFCPWKKWVEPLRWVTVNPNGAMAKGLHHSHTAVLLSASAKLTLALRKEKSFSRKITLRQFITGKMRVTHEECAWREQPHQWWCQSRPNYKMLLHSSFISIPFALLSYKLLIRFEMRRTQYARCVDSGENGIRNDWRISFWLKIWHEPRVISIWIS